MVLRALVGDPNRHKPLAHHPSATGTTPEEVLPASMYTLETRYQSIPPKALPNPTSSRLYYLNSKNAGPTPSPITNEGMPLSTLI